MTELQDVYSERSYGGESIGFGSKPGIAVVDFQLGFTDPSYMLGGSPLIQRAVQNSARLLEVARENGVPIATCYTGYNSKRDMPYWKITAVMEDLIEGEAATELDPRTYDPNYDIAMRKSGASMFFQTPAAAFLIRNWSIQCMWWGVQRLVVYGHRSSTVFSGDLELWCRKIVSAIRRKGPIGTI